MLELINVTGTNKNFQLKNISFCAPAGFITGITGKNGSGKSTLFRYISDEQQYYTGEIKFCGQNIRDDFRAFRNNLAVISDEMRFFEQYSANQNIQLLSAFYENWNQDLFLKSMEHMNVSAGQPLSNLSRGEYIKFQLAFAIAHHARLYLLDEATAGMDPVFRKEFYRFLHNLVASEDVTILLTTHIEEEIQIHLDYAGILDKGQLISFHEVEV